MCWLATSCLNSWRFSYSCMGDPLTAVNKRHWIRVIWCVTSNSKKCVKWRSLGNVLGRIKGYFIIRAWNRKLRLSFFVIRELNVLTFLMSREKCLISSVNCDTSVILPLSSDMGNSNKKKREKKMCTEEEVASFEFFYIHIVWQIQLSRTYALPHTWTLY